MQKFSVGSVENIYGYRDMVTRVLKRLLLLFLLGACSLSGPVRTESKAAHYHAAPLPKSWQRKNYDETDLSFENTRSGATLSLNSLCNRYEQESLHSLTNELLGTMKEREILFEEERPLDGRAGLFTRVRGQVDGVPVESLFVVYRKDDCIFDFTLDASHDLSVQDSQDFMDFVRAFHYGSSEPGKGLAGVKK